MSEYVTDPARPHLGGFIAGGDANTYCEPLWSWLVEKLSISSVVDIGCGEGHALDWFQRKGCRVWGIDGVEQENPRITQHDFTEGPVDDYAMNRNDYDLAWACEFVEHVEERFMPNYLRVFELAQTVAITHAEPGQPGWHHVNCQPSSYWKGVMAAIGYHFDPQLTIHARSLCELPNHFARSGLVFTRSPV